MMIWFQALKKPFPELLQTGELSTSAGILFSLQQFNVFETTNEYMKEAQLMLQEIHLVPPNLAIF